MTNSPIKNSKILIFGGTGSLGKVLIKKYIDNNSVCVYSRDESKHWTIRNEMSHDNLSFIIGDIRDKQRCKDAILQFKPKHIILASALKHVDVCEISPEESIKTNIEGISNVISVIKDNFRILENLKTVLMVSTDKACSPINVYGMCKSIAERVVTSSAELSIPVKFIAVRYGNVLESRGSIIPLFKYQSENCNEITVTDRRMTRFVMTLDESARLIDATIQNGDSGQTWVPRLPAMKVLDLAEIYSEMSGKPIKIIGMRPGEKLHEDLINISESMRTRQIEKYFAISSSFTTPFQSDGYVMKSNMNLMTKEGLRNHLESLDILHKPLSQFLGKSIEELKK